MSPWSYTAGKPSRGGKPSSLVRVYERSERDGLFLSCAWRKTASGRSREEALPAGTTREDAENMADRVAAERIVAIQRGDFPASGHARRGPVTLARLLATYHESRRAKTWSQTHARDQERWRQFWLDRLGRDRHVSSISAAEVENAAGAARQANGWSDSTEAKAVKYLKAATRYAERKADILANDPLTAAEPVTVEPPSDPPSFSEREVAALCRPHEAIDWRVTLACSIAADTGRRIGAIRRLRSADVKVEPGGMWLDFAAESDKGGKADTVPVSAETAELVLDALERAEVQSGGWLLPGGHEGTSRRADTPWGGHDDTGSAGPIRKLHKAETVLGIAPVKGRGYHGIKRAHVSASWEIAGGDAAKVGDLTGNTSPDVLRRHYRKANSSKVAEHMRQVRDRFSGASE